MRARPVLSLIAALVCASLVLVACTPMESDEEPSGVTASTSDGTVVTVTAPEITDEILAGAGDLAEFGDAFMSVPVELSIEGDVPETGVVLWQVYAAPIPDDAGAAFVFWNEEWDTWQAVPSELSSDRGILTATVTHLSLWSAVVSAASGATRAFADGVRKAGVAVADGAQLIASKAADVTATMADALSTASESLYHLGGEVFSLRADAPTCSGSTPDWVDSVIHIEDDQNNPVRFCSGGDRSLLTVSAVANRGYAMNYSTAATPESTTSSSDAMTFADAVEVVANLDQAVSSSIVELAGGRNLLLPGETLTLSYTRDAAKTASGGALLTFSTPDATLLMLSVLSTTAVKLGLRPAEGMVAAATAAVACGNAASRVDGLGSGLSALTTCVDSADAAIARQLSLVLLEFGKSPQEAGGLAGKILGKFTLVMILASALAVSTEAAADSGLSDGARTVTVFTRATPSASLRRRRATACRWLRLGERGGAGRFRDCCRLLVRKPELLARNHPRCLRVVGRHVA